MIDLTPRLLPQLESNRLLDLGPDAFFPAYGGSSIANLPASILDWLGADPLPSAAPRLNDEIHRHLPGRYRNVILFVLDGFGLDMFQRAVASAPSNPRLAVWGGLPEGAVLAPLTSVVPSTTATALTTFWSGAYPAEHGVVGYTLFLKEYGLIANMILHNPATFKSEPGSLRQAGFNPETFLPVPTLTPHLLGQGVRVTASQHQAIARSGLSTMLFPGARVAPVMTLGDLFVTLREALDSSAERSYTWLYWGELDDLAHRYGPGSERFERGLAEVSLQLGWFLDEQRGRKRGDTLFLLTADHGHIFTPHSPALELRHYPDLLDCLAMLPSGETRLPYLFLRPGREDRFRRLVDETWPGRFRLVPSAEFIQAGMFGPRGPHSLYARLAERAGDLVAVPAPGDYWWFDLFRDNPLLGRHGGLTRTEMLVPLLAVEL